MKTRKVVIRGKNIRKFLDLFPEQWRKVTLQPREDVCMFASERYYARNNSQLMTCVLISFTGEEECAVDIVAGGGGTGVFSVNLGAEDAEIQEVKWAIKKVCQARDWSVTDAACGDKQ